MTEAQQTATVTQIPVSELISLLTAISNRDYFQFNHIADIFVNQYGVEVWEEYFNFRLLPALDNASDKWLFEQNTR